MLHDQRLHVLDLQVAAENAHDLAATLATLTADCEFVDDPAAASAGGRSA